jgi:hypothetical protein
MFAKAEPGDHFTMTDCVRLCKQLWDARDAYRDALKARNVAYGMKQTDAEVEKELLETFLGEI